MINEQVQASDISWVETRSNLEHVFQQTKIPSLARSVLQVFKPESILSKVLNLTDEVNKNTDNGKKVIDLATSSTEIRIGDAEPIKVRITQEALDDFSKLYGDPYPFIARSLRGYTNLQENDKLIEIFKEKAVEVEPLVFSDSQNAETIMFELLQKVGKATLEMNRKSLRTFYSYAIVPYQFVSSVMTTYAYTTGLNTSKASELIVADLGQTKYFVNPKIDDDYVYVGLKHPTIESLSTGFFGDYQTTIQQARESDYGGLCYYIYNRFGISVNHLHVKENPFLIKFKVSFNV